VRAVPPLRPARTSGSAGRLVAARATIGTAVLPSAPALDLDAFGTTFVTLLVIMDPIGVSPVFLAITSHLGREERRRAAIRAALAAGALVLGFALVGRFVLAYLGVSVESLSVAGGLLLLLVALEMLRGQDYPDKADPSQDVALVPLATPLVAGPGAIAAVIVLSRQYESGGERIALVLAVAAAVAVVAVTLLAAERLSRLLPESVIQFLTRVMGLLLGAIAVQLVVDGIRGLV